MRVRVDQTKCQGHALCNFAAPEVFEISDEDGRSTVVWTGDIPEEWKDRVRDAVLGCPEEAIQSSVDVSLGNDERTSGADR